MDIGIDAEAEGAVDGCAKVGGYAGTIEIIEGMVHAE